MLDEFIVRNQRSNRPGTLAFLQVGLIRTAAKWFHYFIHHSADFLRIANASAPYLSEQQGIASLYADRC
ncbi:hypothetical protein KX816_15885 [Sphingosinicellaceae bacterium]|nr:hypothetical protein KX816_15885 [Sphingosinicellaceae bacterium]